jgi:hypothetical protein
MVSPFRKGNDIASRDDPQLYSVVIGGALMLERKEGKTQSFTHLYA